MADILLVLLLVGLPVLVVSRYQDADADVRRFATRWEWADDQEPNR